MAKRQQSKSLEATEICDEVLWNNRHITCDENSLYDRYFINKGIVKVGDNVSMRQGDYSSGLKPKKNSCYMAANFLVGQVF